jgi:hypothetical protein
VVKTRDELSQYVDRYPFWTQTHGILADPRMTQLEVWYGEKPYYVRLIPERGTLAGDIARFKADLPEYGVDLEIVGDDKRFATYKEYIEPEDEDDDEDCSDALALLPTIAPDPLIHFVKPTSYECEIHNLLRCRGSPYVVQLLGKTDDNRLVFPKAPHDLHLFSIIRPHLITIPVVKAFMLHLVDGVAYLHSQGIVHRDLTLRNLLYSGNLQKPVVIADLQCRWATMHCSAPEVREYMNFTPASDVFAIGSCLREFVLCHNLRSPFTEYNIPPPFDTVYAACTRELAAERPTLPELREMLEEID